MTEGQSRNLNMSRGRRLKRTNDFVDDGFTGAMQQFRFSTFHLGFSFVCFFHIISCISVTAPLAGLPYELHCNSLCVPKRQSS